MDDLEKLRHLLQSIKNIKNEDIFRSESYSIFVLFLLSTEIFTYNPNIKEFLEKNSEFNSFLIKYEMELKEYLFKSRTVLIGRFIRIVEKADIKDLKLILKIIQEIAFFESKGSKTINNGNKNEENYFDSLLGQFKRGN
ncbi:hypothetical protein [Lysinibacillus sp. BSL11]